jgi:glycopeptide antibiotics resistance protein
MNYISIAIKALPIAGFIAAVCYLILIGVTKNKRQKPSPLQTIAEFTLLGWFVMFIYITQVMSFGNGLGELVNLTPLQPIYLAIKYGSVNAGMATQILLNVLICIPLGILLPLVMKKSYTGFLPVLGISFAIAFITEVAQLITGRNADIDDVLANTLGGLLGFALYVFGCGFFNLTQTRKQAESTSLENYPLNLAISLILVMLMLSPLAFIKILEGKNEIGYVYYGHLQPIHIEIPEVISNVETTANVYKNIQIETRQALASQLIEITGFDCVFADISPNTSQCRKEEDGRVIFIYPYNTWAVLYDYGERSDTDPSKLPTEMEAVELAKTYLETFHVSLNSVEYSGIRPDYTDENLHLVFTDNTSTKDRFVYGSLEISIGEEGALVDISDRRTYYEFYQTARTISPRKAIDIAVDIGVGEWNGTASVTDIEPSYYF